MFGTRGPEALPARGESLPGGANQNETPLGYLFPRSAWEQRSGTLCVHFIHKPDLG
jgi:hypothetical protein